MALLEWKDEFAIGIASVDFEHRELINFINRMHDHLAEGAGEYTIADFFGELYAMISAHFALEEQTMRNLFDHLARPGSLFLMHHGMEGVLVFQKSE